MASLRTKTRKSNKERSQIRPQKQRNAGYDGFSLTNYDGYMA